MRMHQRLVTMGMRWLPSYEPMLDIMHEPVDCTEALVEVRALGTQRPNVVALERSGGGSLVAEISDNNGTRFNFKLAGAPSEDPGLDFTR